MKQNEYDENLQQQTLLDTKFNVKNEIKQQSQQEQVQVRTGKKELMQTGDIAIPDISSSEQILYFTTVNRNGIKGIVIYNMNNFSFVLL